MYPVWVTTAVACASIACGLAVWNGSWSDEKGSTLEPETIPVPAEIRSDNRRLYKIARHHWNRATRRSLDRSVALFERILRADQADSRALAGLADAYNLQAIYRHGSPEALFASAEQRAREAIELDPELPDAYSALGYTLTYGHNDYERAAELFQTGLAIDRSHAKSHHWLSECLSLLGRHEEAIRHAWHAVAIEPASVVFNWGLGRAQSRARRPQLAVEQFERVLDLDPDYRLGQAGLGSALIQLGEYERAIAHYESAIDRVGRRRSLVQGLALAYARSGQTEQAMELARKMESWKPPPRVSIAAVYAGVGKSDAAFHLLNRAAQTPSTSLLRLVSIPLLDPLRRDQRFEPWLRRISR